MDKWVWKTNRDLSYLPILIGVIINADELL